jgi:glucosyl-3-phosphoglycerate phosphatase
MSPVRSPINSPVRREWLIQADKRSDTSTRSMLIHMIGGGRAWPRLLMLRHGATVAPPGVYLGCREDPPLSIRGTEQALRARAFLARAAVEMVITSPLRRALETASLAAPDARPVVDERLRELDLGSFTGLTWEQIKVRDREAALAWRAGGTPPTGEDPRQMWRRSVQVGLQLADRLGDIGGDALVVTHNGPIRALLGSARGLGPGSVRHLRVPHGCLRSLRLTPAVLQRWNELVGEAPAWEPGAK